MTSVEISARTVAEAVEQGLNTLGIPTDEALIEVLEEPRPGFMGLGSRNATVRISVKPEQPVAAAPAPKAAPKADKPQPVAAPKRERAPVSESARPKAAPRPPREDKEYTLPEQSVLDQVAQDAEAFVRELLASMQIEASVTSDVADEALWVRMEGPQVGRIIGHRGETLDALQTLVTQIAASHSGVRLRLDAEGYRARRAAVLANLASDAAQRVRTTGMKVVMEAMPAAERRIIHTKLQEYDDIITESEGDEPRRRVVIFPK